ncbi:hypothetical protein ACFL1B_03345, partial [Nanoarchaeota archaeon]
TNADLGFDIPFQMGGQNITAELSQAIAINIEYAGKIGGEYYPTEEILTDFQEMEKIGRDLAVFPIGERRRQDARELGDVVAQRDDSYLVRHPNFDRLLVFSAGLDKSSDHRELGRFGNYAVGITEFKDPKIPGLD